MSQSAQPDRRLIAVAAAAFVLTAGLHPSRADAEPAFVQTFEEQTPGTIPAGWNVGWGDIGDDLCRVTNIRAVEGRQSMWLDRRHGTNHEPFKLTRTVPDIPDGWAEFSFCMFVDGKAADVSFTVEIGGTHPDQSAKVVVGLRGWGPDIYLYPNALSTWTENWEAKTVMASYEPHQWYRVTLYLPTRGGGQKEGHGLVERAEKNGWKRVGSVRTIPCTPPKKQFEHLSVIVDQNKRDFELFFDEFSLVGRPDLPDLPEPSGAHSER